MTIKGKIFQALFLLTLGAAGGYVLCDYLAEPCETQVIKRAKIKGDGNTMTLEQVKEMQQALDACEKEMKKEEKEEKKRKRKDRKRKD